MISKLLLITLITFSLFLSSCSKQEKADLILTNGKIITVNDDLSEAQAVAIKSDSIMQISVNYSLMGRFANAV